MVHRRNIQSKKRFSSKKVSSRTKRIKPSELTPILKQTPTENLDDETKLAKRHLTKEMWQLVSIAVKRMADELVSISNNQRTTYQEQTKTSVEINNLPGQSNTGAGDEPFVKEKSTTENESIKRRTSPLQILEPSVQIKKKGSSNNATRRSMKSKILNKSSKKNGKVMNQHWRHHQKSK
jgi:hypothetical protein